MSDKYETVRSLPFLALAVALGLDINLYKTRKNGEHYGPCPIHGPKTNTTSFSYATDGRFHCFSCNAKGRGAIDLVKLVKEIGFQPAVEFLQAVPGIEPSKEKEPPISDSGGTDEVPVGLLKPFTGSYHRFAVPCPWLEARCPDQAVRELYGLFCYNNPARKSVYSNRVMIPIRDSNGTLYGYLARHVDPERKSTEPKYIWPKGLPKTPFLFGADVVKAGTFGQAPLDVVYVGESPWMVMRFAMMNLPAVALFGWSASPEQIQTLATLTHTVCYLPDRNKAGQEAAGVVQSLARRLWVKAPSLPDGVDDGEYLTIEQIQAL